MRMFLAALTGLALAGPSLSGGAFTVASEAPDATTERQLTGAELAAELGCGGCHIGVPGPATVRSRAPALGAGTPPLDPVFVFGYLADPVRRRDDIGASRMPDFRLDEAERVALALHLGTGPPTGAVAEAAARHPGADAALGARIYGVLGCASCHGGPDPSPRVGPDLTREGARVRSEWLTAFLADPVAVRTSGHPQSPGSRMPDFRLDPAEVDALAGYLVTLGTPSTDDPPPLTPFQAARAERSFRDRMACLGCHRKDGEGGTLGPSLDGVARRLRPSYVAEIIRDPTAAASRAMPRQRMPDAEVERLARWLLDDPGPWEPAPVRSLADPDHPAWPVLAAAETHGPEAAPALYARHCAACHGGAGAGDGWNAPALPVAPTAHADPLAMGRRPDDTLFDGIHAGAFVLDGSARMPPYGDMLDLAHIRALVAHIRTLCACTQPAWAGDGGRE